MTDHPEEGSSEEALAEANVLAKSRDISLEAAIKELLESKLLGLGTLLADLEPGSTTD